MDTTIVIRAAGICSLVVAGLLLGIPARAASQVMTIPYRGTDALRGLETPPTVTEIQRRDPTTGYLKIRTITTRTPSEVSRALGQLSGVQRLILDLRGNGGGRLEAARDIAELFLHAGVLLYREREGTRTREIRSRGPTGSGPRSLIVLIDKGTASAAEVLAGALHQAGVGRLCGTQSAGKGTIHTADPQAGGRVQWRRTGEVVLRDGTWLTGSGLTPEARGESCGAE